MATPLNVPQHVAIIMDGNGRWAEGRGHTRVFGHVRGSARVKEIVREAGRIGIRALTLFAFSTENWKRPTTEVRVLWKLLHKYLDKEIDELNREGVRLRVIGEVEKLDPLAREAIERAIRRLESNTRLQLNLALSYGSRAELLVAARRFAEDCLSGVKRPENLTEVELSRYLWTAPLGKLGDVDLVIRTSGEKRVSNFLLWQAAYAEYYFTDVPWPEFRGTHLKKAVEDFSCRDRRFGAVKSTPDGV